MFKCSKCSVSSKAGEKMHRDTTFRFMLVETGFFGNTARNLRTEIDHERPLCSLCARKATSDGRVYRTKPLRLSVHPAGTSAEAVQEYTRQHRTVIAVS